MKKIVDNTQSVQRQQEIYSAYLNEMNRLKQLDNKLTKAPSIPANNNVNTNPDTTQE